MVREITEKQAEIIEAAGKVLSRCGISNLTIKNLAKEMRFSESAIYRHFTSKEEIILSMLSYLASAMDDRLQEVVSEHQGDIESKFRAIFDRQLNYFHHNPHFIIAAFSDVLLEENEKINEVILKIISIKHKHLKPIIHLGQQKEFFTSEISTDEIIHIIMGSFRLLMFKWRIANFEFDVVQQGKRMVDTLLIILRPKK